MAHFSWTDDLYTGNKLIDGEHRALVGLVNALFETMNGGQGNERMSKAMHELIVYTGDHFGREEAQMERIQYVASLAHKAEHTKLLRQLTDLGAMLEAGGKINIPAVSDFLSEWLRNHILTMDMKLGAALQMQHSGEPAPQQH
ncbi:MAG: hemerythrin family protein [Burkholderiales bacterium]|nr:hemerythrin family protein [Burkholderiales bacterium]